MFDWLVGLFGCVSRSSHVAAVDSLRQSIQFASEIENDLKQRLRRMEEIATEKDTTISLLRAEVAALLAELDLVDDDWDDFYDDFYDDDDDDFDARGDDEDDEYECEVESDSPLTGQQSLPTSEQEGT